MSIDNFYNVLREFSHCSEDLLYLLDNDYIAIVEKYSTEPTYYIILKPVTFCNVPYYKDETFFSSVELCREV